MHCFSLLLFIEADPSSLVSSFTQMMLRSHHLRESADRDLSSRIIPSRSTMRLASLSLLGGLQDRSDLCVF
jgi:hypothetical protein